MTDYIYPKGRLVIDLKPARPEAPQPPKFTTELKLYPYQQEALEKITEAGRRRFARWSKGMGKAVLPCAWDLAFKPSESTLALYRRAHPGIYRFWKRMDWANWHITRGRMPWTPSPSDFRRVSWRRPL